MFTWIGRYYSHWYTNPIPFLRRLAKNNPSDYGKLVVFGTIMSLVNWWAITNTEKIANFVVSKAFRLPDLSDEIDMEENDAYQADLFQKRYGTLNPGDTVIFDSHNNEHIEAVFKQYYTNNELLVETDSGPIAITRDQVLDVTPQF